MSRTLELLGSYENGISRLADTTEEQRRQHRNQQRLNQLLDMINPQACLVGNLDLLGTDLHKQLGKRRIPTIQHVGFMAAPYGPQDYPQANTYRLAFASREVKRLLIAQGFPVDNHPIVHPPLTSAMTAEAPIPKRQSPMLQIGYSGLLMHSKGVHNLLEACVILKQRHVPYQLNLAGKPFSPDYLEQLQTYARQQGIDRNLHWHGFLEDQAITSFYQQLDVLVFPSLHPEAFGMVVAEAMAQGVVPISTGAGGAFEVITHGVDGLLCEPGSGESVSAALQWCHGNRQKLSVLSQNGIRHARSRFNSAQSAKVLDQTFRTLAELNSSSATDIQLGAKDLTFSGVTF
ncbi:glycosyltransferase [Cyanobium sp. HWJ4-Hawea]|uniref:glycosyltransferase family 4 protein n=1 Tax=Cyanobium sp. HWJ4-Hawea TaxID=2823713 RepID=UPI0020CC610D|nr:glycosyltransferase [Cyanobium sp. HWJ4-Hawea]MCP9809140.1 glycosyltransferase [Cyanobium sp. HWJ4-Hawea]